MEAGCPQITKQTVLQQGTCLPGSQANSEGGPPAHTLELSAGPEQTPCGGQHFQGQGQGLSSLPLWPRIQQ